MGKTILDIKILYPSLGAAEKRVADFLMADPSRVLPLSITELAEQSGGSEATIVRLAKRLGFSGYQQLKISIAQEENVAATDAVLRRRARAMTAVKIMLWAALIIGIVAGVLTSLPS